MNKHDENAIRAGVRIMCERRQRAYDGFVDGLTNDYFGLAPVDARTLAQFYLDLKLIKYDGTAYTVKHGALLDKAVMARALADAVK